MTHAPQSSYDMAVHDFQRARRQAVIRQIMSRLQGKSDTLLCFDDVRRAMKTGPAVDRGLQEIPLDKIVGSVGRYKDFTRSFLPTKDSNQERWARVKAAVTDMKGMPPIDVYKLGEVYFVNDGNHRVSVARQLGTKTIAAHVTEIEMRVPLSADDDPDEVICKAHYADFLEKTNLDQRYPEANLLMTFAGHYEVLLDQIDTECCLLGKDKDGRCLPENWDKAVEKWYEHVYLPVVQIIRELGGLHRFPGRTETDIYVLVSERREELEEALGWHLDPETTVPELVAQKSDRPLLNLVLDSVAPALEKGPRVGRWREQQLILHREHHLFENILVLFEGIPGDWDILEQMIEQSQGDDDYILGLYVARDHASLDRAAVENIQKRFSARCHEAGMRCDFVVEIGRFDQVIVKRAAWVDLVVINLTDPPEPNPLARLRSSWGTIIQRCPRPILAIPNAVRSPQDRILLGYDGSPKADEALFVATYLAARWQRALTVLTVQTANTTATALERARGYLLENGVDWAKFVLREGPIHKALLETAADHQSNLLIIGGFGFRPALRLVLGSTVEHLLRKFKQPLLICR